jgi:Gti1/Pac2 family transcription factor
LSGALNHVARRPHDRERVSLIKSGNVFIYEEHSSGIKRWTDGVPWSPSRILGNFLVYRELERPFPPGEKKRAMKRSKRSPGISKQEPFGSSNGSLSGGYNSASAAASSFDTTSGTSLSKETERSLIGSLVDSYGFKEEGLVKKTVSVTVGGVSHHLVSYYTVADVMNNKFTTPSKDPRFQHVTPRGDLITKQNFRTPIDEVDSMDRIDDRSVYAAYPYARNGYEMTNQTISHRPMSLPTPPVGYGSGSSMFGNYAMNTHSTSYESLGQGPASAPYSGHFVPSPGIYPTSKTENYDIGGYRQQRYNSVIGNPSDTGRSRMPSVTTNFAHRPSNFEQAGSMDSGISGVSASSSDSKLTNDSGYSSQGFYGSLRDTSNNSHNYTHHRALPTPSHQPTYDRAHAPSYSALDSSNIKENMWPIGNASAGHGHYMAAQQQWASTGTS